MKSIKSKILLLVLSLIIGTVSIVVGVSSVLSYVSTITTLEQSMSNTASISAKLIDSHIDKYRRELEYIASNDIFSKIIVDQYPLDNSEDYMSKEDLRIQLVEQQERSEFSNIFYITSDGMSLNDMDLSNEDYFLKSKETLKTFVADPIVNSENGNSNIILSTPIVTNGEFQGALLAVLDAHFLSDITNDLKIGENGTAEIQNGQGTTIGYNDIEMVLTEWNTIEKSKDDSTLNTLAEIDRKKIAGESSSEMYSFNGEVKLKSYTPIPNTNGWSIDISILRNDYIGDTITGLIISVAISLIAVILCIIIMIRFANTISNPIKLCVDRFQKLSEGDLTSPSPKIHAKDEVGLLANATSIVLSRLQSMILDEERMLDEMSKGNFTSVTQSPESYIGDFSPLLTSIQNINKNLNKTISQINQASDQVSSGADQVSSGAQMLSQGSTEQAASIEQLSSMLGEILIQVKSNADNANEANIKTLNSNEQVHKSNDSMKDLIIAMTDINAKSNEINKIIKTIDDIAFQTNILALNAAVEAARAGEAGKGFAVVADEVRNLAGKSAAAAKNTSILIEDTINAITNGSKIATETAASMLSVVDGTQLVLGIVANIAKASNEQSIAITQVSLGVEQISAVVQTNSATAEESAAASEELSGQSHILKNLVETFKINEIDKHSEYYETHSSNDISYNSSSKY